MGAKTNKKDSSELKELTELEEKFCQLYISGKRGVAGNATESAYRAGFNFKTRATYASHGCDLLKKPNVQARCEELRRIWVAPYEASRDKVMQELAYVGFSRLTNVVDFDDDGMTLKSSEDLPDAAAAAIRNLQFKTDVFEGENGTTTRVTKRVVQHDKVAALRILTEVLGMKKEQPDAKGSQVLLVPATIKDVDDWFEKTRDEKVEIDKERESS